MNKHISHLSITALQHKRHSLVTQLHA